MSAFVGSVDQGTSSSRFTIYNQAGNVIASAQEQFELLTPQPGWAEQDPLVLLSSVTNCIDQAVAKAANNCDSFDVKNVKAIGITNQRETTLVWDRESGQPLYNALVWLDTRTTGVVDDVANEVGGVDALREKCGLPLATYFSGVKLRWLYENSEKVKKAMDEETCLVGTVDAWLIWKLTNGQHVTDVTNASRTMLMDLKSCEWDKELCKTFKVNPKVLPKIKSSAEEYGNIAQGPLKGVPIAGCLGDQQAALVGQRCFEPGLAKNTYGTGCFMLLHTGQQATQSKHGLLSTVAYQLGSKAPINYALEGSIANAGSAVNWLISNLKLVSDVKELNEQAASVKDTGDVYFVPAFSGLFAPHWRDDARGVIVGLTQYSHRSHICRALLEAVCYQTKEVLDAMKADSGIALKSLRVDGGMTKSDLLMQMQADCLAIPVERPDNRETTSLGAALAAGLATGVWKDEDAINATFSEQAKCQLFNPEKNSTIQFENGLKRWKLAIERSCNWAK